MANEIIPGLGVHHIALQVKNYEESLRFYTEGLGMKVYASWGTPEKTITLLDMGEGQYIELFNTGSDEAEVNSKYMHLALRVPDVEDAYEKALAAGAVTRMAPKIVETHSSPVNLTLQCAFVNAPGGEQVEFFRVVSAE